MRYFELPSNYTHNPGESHEAYELIFLERGLFLDTSETPTVTMKPGDAVVYGQHYFSQDRLRRKKSSAVVVILTFYSDSPALKEYLSGRHYFKVTPEQQKAARKHTVAYAKGVGHQFARM